MVVDFCDSDHTSGVSGEIASACEFCSFCLMIYNIETIEGHCDCAATIQPYAIQGVVNSPQLHVFTVGQKKTVGE